MNVYKITKREHAQYLAMYDKSDKMLYMFGRKTFGMICGNYRIDVELNEVKITNLLKAA